MRRKDYYVLRDKSRGLWKKLGAISHSDAKTVLRDYEEKRNRLSLDLPVVPVEVTFKETADEYLGTISHKAPSTIKKEKEVLLWFCRSFGDKGLAEVTAKDIMGCLSTHAPDTVHDRVKVMRNLYSYAIKKLYLTKSPVTEITLPRIEEKLPRCVDPALIERVFKHMQGTILAYYKILYFTGLRPGEALRLKTSEIDLPNRRLFVTRSKTKKFRVLPINEKLVPFLKPLLGGEYLFPGSFDGHQKSMKMGLRRAVVKAKLTGKRISPYAFRHTFATQVLKNTANLRAVQTLLGHSRSTMTERYAHVLNEQLKEAVETL